MRSVFLVFRFFAIAISLAGAMLGTMGPGLAAPRPASLSQPLPRYADPEARRTPLDLGAVPAIRFLTTADFPPFNYRDANGQLVGYNVDLARDLCAALELACTIQAWPWDQAEDALASSQGDALIAGLAMTPKAGERFDFTRIYLEFPARFAVSKAAATTFDVANLAHRKVAVRAQSRHADFLRRYLPAVEPVPEPDEFKALEAVRDGKADAYFGDGMRAAFWINAHPECCALTGPAFFRPDFFGQGLAIAVPAGRDAIRLALDQGLDRLAKSGKLDELYLRWFPVGFY